MKHTNPIVKSQYKWVRAILPLLLFVLCMGQNVSWGQQEAKKLARRILGDRAIEFRMVCKPSADGKNYFALIPDKDAIVIEGDCDNSLAMGLNYYLKHYARVHVSWYVEQPVELPSRFPKIKKEERHEAAVPQRFFLNYCTFSYTMLWWQWKEWEHFIDWMALNGINMPLAQTGQEAVWQEVWRSYGLKDEEIRRYFSDAAHLPWHRMANLDGYGGPLPQSWIDSQKQLQMKIVQRERELGMTPVLPAFAGHVPSGIQALFPEADIQHLSAWCGFEPTSFLNSSDPLFADIQQRFLAAQQRIYGSDHIYSCDPFNEMDPPSWEEDYLATIAQNIYRSLQQVDPQAQWLQMSWVFYYKRNQWTTPRLKAYLSAVPRDKMMLLDYFCENTEVWRHTLDSAQTDSLGRHPGFFGQPFVWCYLGNFGGNTMLVGNLRALDEKMGAALRESASNLRGMGSTLESFDNSPQTYEFLFERIWQQDNPHFVDEFITEWADLRYGKSNKSARAAWQLLVDSVYRDWSYYGLGTLMSARPSLEGHGTYYTKPYYSYDNETLLQAVRLLMKQPSSRAGYQYDVVNLLSQWMANQFLEIRDAYAQAYQARDPETMKRLYDQAAQLFRQADALLFCNPNSNGLHWFQQAWAYAGDDKNLHKLYERQSRTLLTLWGGPVLNDYANRLWSNILSDYYWEIRWKPFFRATQKAVADGVSFNEKAFLEELSKREEDFALRTYYISFKTDRSTNAIAQAQSILKAIDHGDYEVPDRIQATFQAYMQCYPQATLRDVYKWCFQDVYGPAHLITDSVSCARYIQEELAFIPSSDSNVDYEYCGPDGHYVRVNLCLVKEGIVPLELLTHQIILSSKGKKMPLYDWKGMWQLYQTKLSHVVPQPQHFSADAQQILDLLNANNYVAHHSSQFNDSYHFHYRLVRRDLFEANILPLLQKF